MTFPIFELGFSFSGIGKSVKKFAVNNRPVFSLIGESGMVSQMFGKSLFWLKGSGADVEFIEGAGVKDVIVRHKKRLQDESCSLLRLVTPTGQFLNHLLERFRKIYELKAVIPVQMLQPAILPKRLKVA